MAAFWACACKLSWTLLSPARVQPLYRAERKESSGTGLIPHISCLMAAYSSIEWDPTWACEGASGCRYQSIFDLSHPPNPCMKCEMKLEIDHLPETTCLTLFDKYVGSLTSPANHVTLKMQVWGMCGIVFMVSFIIISQRYFYITKSLLYYTISFFKDI